MMANPALGAVEDDEGKSWEASDINFVTSKVCGCAGGIVLGKLDMKEVYISVVLLHVADHGSI